jgi:hypothetical protein
MYVVVVKCVFIRLLRFSCVGIIPKFVHATQSVQTKEPLRLSLLKGPPVPQEGPTPLHPLHRKSCKSRIIEAMLFGPKVVVRIRRDMS